MTWSFFESGHGKGEHDGAGKDIEIYPLFWNILMPLTYLSFIVGACVKSALRRYQLKRDANLLDDAHKIVEWCTKHMTLSASTWVL